ncbi:MAG: glycosyltransferase [Flavobacteriaceae bacterium]|uniref:Glycosyltransferase n=1 Tax=Flavobacterium kayseriense TaxID=2764714 RepID=A0ABR7J795_9FLAO|nr:glycosyltransferase [Flavobacterium kayseriense]MBC5841414.1 glycosyltransferase [Flavobacterium kayseriense]MBC5847942.1 glycosyltransferase [Flavobacterium kayseriense]MBX9889599.1 glycosyltransferase [Flavobacteriaceae bacterium]
MNFLIITHVSHIYQDEKYHAYAPYTNEMNVWAKYADEITLLAPQSCKVPTAIDSVYQHNHINFMKLENFDILTIKSIVLAVSKVPKILVQMYQAMQKADHIHLRCPGNIGLLGCFVQILFPNKKKTAKYAGNWDPKAKQPWTYKLQQKILQNTFLTRNMQVLIYGEWEGQTKNSKSFFTASYREEERVCISRAFSNTELRFIFVGSLVKGKDPMYAIQLIEQLYNKGYAVTLDLYGEGAEREYLEQYILKNNVDKIVTLKGNQDRENLKKAYQKSDFVVLPSNSEGWPKAIAEGMFWGCVPLATNVSCVSTMFNREERGLLLTKKLNEDVATLVLLIDNPEVYNSKQKAAITWSRRYTLDLFESEIKKLIL